MGLEETPQEYINHIVEISCEVMRVLKKSGVFFLNLGDTYYTKSGSGLVGDKLKDRLLDRELSSHANSVRGKYKTNWLQSKQKLLIPHRIAISLQDKGFIIRDDCVWIKKLLIYPDKESIGVCMPFPVIDKFLPSTEYIFQIVKCKKYYFNLEELKTPIKQSSKQRALGGLSNTFLVDDETNPFQKHKKGMNNYYEKINNGKSVGKGYKNWNVGGANNVENANPTNAIMFRRSDDFSKEDSEKQHYASFPENLPKFFILAGCPKEGIVLDPFAGSGTTLISARKLGRNSIGIEMSSQYCDLIKKRLFKGNEPLDKKEFELIR